ncbi:hypothetical protein D4740_06605 [Actinomyces sp. 2119]|uniref:cyclophilin-like fold protein n=1 Tax=Actinomyces sp. 2119 TaxID=2321393 RepID=UPI000E6CD4FD|nr:cyclophilin-like fold protein [Actinomyces sp. 2119]RJF42585.1 hypothetical protein D4740_06605 [Actinomyces sp. 2119]
MVKEHARRTVLASTLASLASLPLSVCGCAPVSDSDQAAGARTGSGTSPRIITSPAATASQGEHTPIIVRVNGTAYPAHLNGTQTAQALVARLPLTASFRDYSPYVAKKVADLDEPLDHDQMPNDDPVAGDIVYWSYKQQIALYWRAAYRYIDTHVIGTFDSPEGVSAVQALTPQDEVVIALA